MLKLGRVNGILSFLDLGCFGEFSRVRILRDLDVLDRDGLLLAAVHLVNRLSCTLRQTCVRILCVLREQTRALFPCPFLIIRILPVRVPVLDQLMALL